LICWSCERAAGDGVTCGVCGAIQPADPTQDHFRVLNVPKTFALDVAQAEARFRELSRIVHPDRFATSDPRAKRFSTQRTVQLNEAWRTLKDAVRRAEYLLSQAGFDIGAETGASRPGSGAGAREKIALPAGLLARVLELREDLADARSDGDQARVQALAGQVRQRLGETMEHVAAIFASMPSQTGGASQPALESIAHDMIELRYLRRFLDEVDAHDEAQAAGSTHA
jgi:molecular chaperone HscB